MRALLDYASVVHYEDEVGVADCGEPVGDDEVGSTRHQGVHGPLDQHLCSRVHAACGLVEDEDRGVGEHGAGYGQSCFWPCDMLDASSFSTVS